MAGKLPRRHGERGLAAEQGTYPAQVARGGEVFSLCRFRQIEGGYEFLFNLSNTGLTPQEVEELLLSRLPAEIVKREFF